MNNNSEPEYSNMDDEDHDDDRGEPYIEQTEEFCPDCKSPKMIRYMQQNGPDDFDWVWECLACGTTQST